MSPSLTFRFPLRPCAKSSEIGRLVKACFAEYDSSFNSIPAPGSKADWMNIVRKAIEDVYKRQRKGYEFDQIRTRIIVRKKVHNEYTVE